MKKTIFTAILLGAAVALCSCSLGVDSRGLLSPPKTTGREAAIEKLVEEASGGNYQLKYPNSGSYRSAIITEDLNQDNNDEAFAFYTSRSENTVHMLVMYSEKNEWKISGDFKTDHSDVDCVMFADYDFDGTLEILAGFSGSAELNELNIFDYDPEKRVSESIDFSASYSGFSAGDYDRDGGSEILTLSLSVGEDEAQASLIDYDNNTLYTLSDCYLDPSVTRFENITSGLLDKNTMGVAVDGALDGGFNTQVIFYDADKSELVSFPSSEKKETSIFRTYNINSQDINHDGFIEIPVAYAEAGPSTEKTAPVINWRNLNTKKSKLVNSTRCVNNLDFGFYFKLPEYFSDAVFATLSEDSREMKIYAEENDLLLTFKVFDVGENSDKMKEFTTLESYNQYIYAYQIGESTTLYVDDDIIRDNFALIDIGA